MNLVRKNSGQAILTVLLIMVVGLTVSLAVVARSVTSVKISTQEEESQRAFSAAEAGLEETLLSGAAASGTLGNASYTVIIPAGSTSGKFIFPEIIKQDDTQALWLVGHDGSDNIIAPGPGDQRYPIGQPVDICWESPGAGDEPAMEIIILHQRTIGANEYKVARGAYDPDGRRNNFSGVTSSGGSECGDFNYRQRIVFSDFFNTNNQRVVAVRLRPIYNGARVAACQSGCPAAGNIPPQGEENESTGAGGTPPPQGE